MSLKRILKYLVPAVLLALVAIVLRPPSSFAEDNCPDAPLEIYAGQYVNIDVSCYDTRLNEGYHLFAMDSDNPPQLGEAYAYNYDGASEIDYFSYSAGEETLHYVLRKGTDGTDFAVGSLTLVANEISPVVAKVAKLLTASHPAKLKWNPTDDTLKYKLLAGTYAENGPRIIRTIKPAEVELWKTRLRDVDYEIYLVEDRQWIFDNGDHVNTRRGTITPNFRSTTRTAQRSTSPQKVISGWGTRR